MSTEPNRPYNNNRLDDHINTDLMRICKCILPYMDQGVQKKMAITIKLLELVSVMNIFSADDLSPPLSLTRGEDWEKTLLLDIRSQLSPEKAYLVDAALKVGELKNIMALKSSLDALPNPQVPPNVTSEEPPNTSTTISPNDIIDKFSPLLDDNQKQLLKLFSTFMK